MKNWQVASAWVLLIAVLPLEGSAKEAPKFSLRQAIRAGNFELPAEWAGVWAYRDTTRDCDSSEILFVDTGLDTLCAGMPLGPDSTGGFEYSCSGTVTATEVDLTCSFIYEFPSCVVTYEQTTHATRNGDTARVHFQYRVTSVPTFCAFMEDSCEDLFEELTRMGPQPPECTTPVEPSTWSRIKTWYR